MTGVGKGGAASPSGKCGARTLPRIGPGEFAAGFVAAAVLALAVLVFPALSAAQDTEWNRYTLDGLDGVHVRAETNEACEGAGVSAESIRAEAEAALGDADVPLLTREEMLASPGLPELRVTFECGGGVAGMVGYSVSIRVQQAVQMIRDTQITHSEAVTWFGTAVGVSEAGGTAEAMGTTLVAKLAEFSEAFAAANVEAEGPG